MHNVHDNAPVVFQTRWALSYLRGPLSRDQVRTLTPRAAAATATAAPAAGGAASAPAATTDGTSGALPVLPPGIQQFFVPAAAGAPVSRYTPVVIGAARVGFVDARLGVDEVRDVLYAAPFGQGAIALDWAAASRLDAAASSLLPAPAPGAAFGAVPAAGLQARSYAAWSKDFAKWVAQEEKIELLRQRDLKMTSDPGESERDFTVRVQESQREARDAAVDALRKKFSAKQAQLAEQLRRARAAVERETAQASQQKLQTGLTMGATLLGALFGRRSVSAGATSAARGVGRSMKEAEDIKAATQNVEAVEARQQALEEEIEGETRKIAGECCAAADREAVALAEARPGLGAAGRARVASGMTRSYWLTPRMAVASRGDSPAPESSNRTGNRDDAAGGRISISPTR